jgi:hypothetical protein
MTASLRNSIAAAQLLAVPALLVLYVYAYTSFAERMLAFVLFGVAALVNVFYRPPGGTATRLTEVAGLVGGKALSWAALGVIWFQRPDLDAHRYLTALVVVVLLYDVTTFLKKPARLEQLRSHCLMLGLAAFLLSEAVIMTSFFYGLVGVVAAFVALFLAWGLTIVSGLRYIWHYAPAGPSPRPAGS